LSSRYDPAKRIVDVAASLLGLIVLSPFLIAVAVLIRREDGGAVFYRGERIGIRGEPFRIFKYRTMVVNAESIGGVSTAQDDPRITQVGKWLRRYKLDELPQLINVLAGDMSIVGPRPEVKRYTDMFTDEEKAILTVRPGITDWASIWNADEGAVLAGAPDPDRAYEELIRPTKLKLQLKYIRERSFLVDMKIIFLTLLVVIHPGSKAVEELRETER
jgi:lipopolysaccharide/colanic/teichoic acid biosynthesis glycosyltransferase